MSDKRGFKTLYCEFKGCTVAVGYSKYLQMPTYYDWALHSFGQTVCSKEHLMPILKKEKVARTVASKPAYQRGYSAAINEILKKLPEEKNDGYFFGLEGYESSSCCGKGDAEGYNRCREEIFELIKSLRVD